jgi:hypothetical protein
MSARRFEVWLTGIPCGGRDLLLQVPERNVQLRECGIEFTSPYPLPLWIEVEVELHCQSLGRPRRHQGVVVACDSASGKMSRISLLFTGQEPPLASAAASAISPDS